MTAGMSEQQKFFASVSGALIAHVLIFAAVFVLLATSELGSASLNPPGKEKEASEIVIDMSELMERLEVEEPEPELKSETNSILPRPYIGTDTNRPEAKAPEGAVFESDRNTSKASELAPDTSLPQREGPTLLGENRFDIFELETREYNAGETGQLASTGLNTSKSSLDQPTVSLVSQSGFKADVEGEDLSRPISRGGEDADNAGGSREVPVEAIADRSLRPGGSAVESDKTKDAMRNTFSDRNGDPNARVREMFEQGENQFASDSDEKTEVGSKLDPEQEKAMASGTVGNKGGARIELETREKQLPEGVAVADAGIFVEGYTRERIQSRSNGTVSNTGENAVDAEETPIGNYKKQVHDAIGKMWYRYLGRNKGNVTWGVLKLEMRVDKYGKIHNLRVVKNEANTLMVEFSLKAVMDAEIPSMPKEVSDILGVGGLDLDYEFIIY
jgi:hypothetical protein